LTNNTQFEESTQYNFKVDLSEKVVTRDKVYYILSKAIFRGDLKPGQRLVESKLAKLMKVSTKELTEFYDISSVLRGLAARKAACNITPQEIKQLQEIICQSEQSLKEGFLKKIFKLNKKFHQTIEKSSNNKELLFLLGNVYERSRERFSEIMFMKGLENVFPRYYLERKDRKNR